MIGQRTDASEEDIAAQPVSQHALALLQQDGPIRNGTHLGASALAGREARLDRVHPAQAHGEEHQGGQHAGAHALEQPEGRDDAHDQQDDAVLRPGKPLAASHQPFVQHAGAGEEEHASHQRHRDQLQHPVAQKQSGCDDEGGNDAGQA